MARKVGQIISRGGRRWLIRVYLGRDHETKQRKYYDRTIHGPMREAQAYLTRKLRERDLGRDLEGAKVTVNEYLDRWVETAVKPRVREKTFQDYEGMLRRYVRPTLGERVLAAMRPLDLLTTYQQMMERGLSAQTVRYMHVVLGSAFRQALKWRLLLEDPGWHQDSATAQERDAGPHCGTGADVSESGSGYAVRSRFCRCAHDRHATQSRYIHAMRQLTSSSKRGPGSQSAPTISPSGSNRYSR